MQSAFSSCVLNLTPLLEFYCILVPKGGNVETYYKPTNILKYTFNIFTLLFYRFMFVYQYWKISRNIQFKQITIRRVHLCGNIIDQQMALLSCPLKYLIIT